MTPQHRYLNDVVFHALVESLFRFCEETGSNEATLHEAAVLAGELLRWRVPMPIEQERLLQSQCVTMPYVDPEEVRRFFGGIPVRVDPKTPPAVREDRGY